MAPARARSGGEPPRENQNRLPHPRLRPFVTSYVGYRMADFPAGVHAGLPSGTLTMIIAFDDRLDVEVAGRRQQFWAMVAGLHDAPALVRHDGFQHGVQLAITPRGAGALLGVPAATLAGSAEDLADVAPSFTSELVDRLTEAVTWRARWAILDQVLLRVLQVDRELPAPLERAWSSLLASHGNTPIAALAEQAGWSRRHFTKVFNEHYGLTPKTMGRVLRFERAQKMLRLPTRPSLASVAAACGYADQAHMTREWTEFAGSPPTIWMRDELVAAMTSPSSTSRRPSQTLETP